MLNTADTMRFRLIIPSRGISCQRVTGRRSLRLSMLSALMRWTKLVGSFYRPLRRKNDQKAYESQLLQKIQATEAEGISKLQQATVLKEAALAENKRLQNEIRQLQQQLELLNASTQDNIPWNDIQPILHQTHGELMSATTRYWNAIDALRNRRLASYLPGSGVIHGNWTEQYDPLGSLGHNSLPGFTESGNPSSSIQQEPEANNMFDSFV
ncbi:hypothetical protein N7513_001790 [Penicillium frequentans]|nr:hypothetical protein N7513_001790 [Penicillium glabrum]